LTGITGQCLHGTDYAPSPILYQYVFQHIFEPYAAKPIVLKGDALDSKYGRASEFQTFPRAVSSAYSLCVQS
jgi:hypothetical protein